MERAWCTLPSTQSFGQADRRTDCYEKFSFYGKIPRKKSASTTGIIAAIYVAREPLKAGAGGADVFAESGDVGAQGADTAGVHGHTEIFCLLDAETGIIEFGEAVAFRGREAISARHIHRARRAVGVPPLSNDVEEVVPISPVPHHILP
jgi:hypothetical protein